MLTARSLHPEFPPVHKIGVLTGGTTMFRKFLGGLTSTAVVAGMVAAGVVATATPAAANFQVPVAPGSGDPVPTTRRATTRRWPSQCGLDFGLVLDSSGSIGNTGIANLKTAANAFVDSLVDTGSKVAVTSFSTNSPGTGGTNLAPTALTSANLTTIKNSYDNLQFQRVDELAGRPGEDGRLRRLDRQRPRPDGVHHRRQPEHHQHQYRWPVQRRRQGRGEPGHHHRQRHEDRRHEDVRHRGGHHHLR